MDTVFWLFLASAVVWLGLGGYLWILSTRMAAIEKALHHLKHSSRLKGME